MQIHNNLSLYHPNVFAGKNIFLVFLRTMIICTVSFFLCGFLIIFKKSTITCNFCLSKMFEKWINKDHVHTIYIIDNIFWIINIKGVIDTAKCKYGDSLILGIIKNWISYYDNFVLFLSLWWQYLFHQWFALQNIILEIHSFWVLYQKFNIISW